MSTGRKTLAVRELGYAVDCSDNNVRGDAVLEKAQYLLAMRDIRAARHCANAALELNSRNAPAMLMIQTPTSGGKPVMVSNRCARERASIKGFTASFVEGASATAAKIGLNCVSISRMLFITPWSRRLDNKNQPRHVQPANP